MPARPELQNPRESLEPETRRWVNLIHLARPHAPLDDSVSSNQGLSLYRLYIGFRRDEDPLIQSLSLLVRQVPLGQWLPRVALPVDRRANFVGVRSSELLRLPFCDIDDLSLEDGDPVPSPLELLLRFREDYYPAL